MPVNRDVKLDTCVLKEIVESLHKKDFHALILLSMLVIVTVLPEDTYPNQILSQIESTSHMRACQVTQASGEGLECLVDPKFHAEVGYSFLECRIDCIRMLQTLHATSIFEGHKYRGMKGTGKENPHKNQTFKTPFVRDGEVDVVQ